MRNARLINYKPRLKDTPDPRKQVAELVSARDPDEEEGLGFDPESKVLEELFELIGKEREEKEKEDLMNSICKECKGFCCETFWIAGTKEELLRSLKFYEKEHPGEHDFIKENFQMVETYVFYKPPYASYAYTCKAWDKETGMCTAYENRPGLCKKYRCETVRDGKLPLKRDPLFKGPIAPMM